MCSIFQSFGIKPRKNSLVINYVCSWVGFDARAHRVVCPGSKVSGGVYSVSQNIDFDKNVS